jgi:serine phosphatase RsbU (regulator of sigma subunit)
VIDLVFEAVNPERAALMINEGEDGLVCRAFRGDDSPDDMHVSRTVADAVVNEQVSVLTSDAQADPRFADGDSLVSMGIRAVMAVPLRRNGKVIGLIYADSRLSSALFKEEDLRVLTMLANIVAIQIENAQRLEERQKRAHLEQELKAAATLQRRLLPRASPRIGGYVVEGVNVPCFEVGGDYFDYVALDKGKFGIVLADVAGKGLAAGMLMMGLQATFHAEVALNPEPDVLLARLNTAMIRSAPRSRFVTMCYLELDAVTHRIRWVNAGHAPAPILARASGGIETLGAGNVPLGILEDISYPVSTIDLAPGDLLLMCSDGVTETIDHQGNEFGLDRLEKLILSLAGRSPSQVQRTVEDRLEKHAAGARPSDDLTMIVLQRTPEDS